MWEGRQTDVQKGECSNIYTYSTYTYRQTDRTNRRYTQYFVREPIQDIGEITRHFVCKPMESYAKSNNFRIKILTFSKFQKVTFVNTLAVHLFVFLVQYSTPEKYSHPQLGCHLSNSP
jgi:hypothetical protein